MEDLPLEIDVHEVHRLRVGQEEEFLLLDCREPDEFEYAKIDGAVLIPLGDVPARAAEIEAFRDQRIVVHCHHGGRSLQVTKWLRQQGFAGAQNLAGGIEAWSLKIDPSVPRY